MRLIRSFFDWFLNKIIFTNFFLYSLSKFEKYAVKDDINWKFIKNDQKPKIIKQSAYIYLN